MILSFLHKTFIRPNVRMMNQPELASKLADYLYALREIDGERACPQGAEQYLDEWASDEKGWLRKYYPPGDDEAHTTISHPQRRRVIDWVSGFEQRQFVTAESRLMMVFELLRARCDDTKSMGWRHQNTNHTPIRPLNYARWLPSVICRSAPSN